MQNNRTFTALLARGVDSATAKHLIAQGYTLKALKQLPESTFAGLGVAQAAIVRIRSGARPPIDNTIVNQVLYQSKNTCCTCRVPGKSIIIHHIEAWSKSRSHDETNLVVLCVDCHDEAHTKHEMSLNLTPERLRHNKAAWTEEVRCLSKTTILTPHTFSLFGPFWDYFNHRRIVDVAGGLSVDVTKCAGYESLLADGNIAVTGEPTWASQRDSVSESYYMYDGFGLHDRRLYRFYSGVLNDVLSRVDIVDLNSCWSQQTFSSLLAPGAVVAFTGGWRFKSHSKSFHLGPGRNRTAYVQKRKIRLEFVFDSWETTSNSALSNLSGSWVCTGIAVVRQIHQEPGRIFCSSTGLAIGSGYSTAR